MANSPVEDSRPYRKGVGIALFNRQGLVFAARRSDAPNAWQMPQGGIDAGESPRAAALRELREETGVAHAEIVAEIEDWLSYDLPALVAARVWGGRYRGQAQKWFALAFTGGDEEIDLSGGGELREFDAWRWIALDELVGAIVPFKRDIYRRVAAEFAPVAKRIAEREARP